VIFNVKDNGGSMTIHCFGAVFGIVASYFFQNEKALKDTDKKYKFSYYSTLIAMIGTLFLFMYWPSFNAARA
jgi:ammonium transporter Rh